MRTVAYFVCLLTTLGLCGCSTTPHAQPLNATSATISAAQASLNVRNNSYSLLYDLLDEEKDVSKLLLIKHESRELNRFIKEVAKTSGGAVDQLEKFGEADDSLELKSTQLPPGEVATRSAIAKTKTKALLTSSGNSFERTLLLTQIEALNYASHLAKVGAEHDGDPARSEYMQSLSHLMNRYYLEAIEMLPADTRNR